MLLRLAFRIVLVALLSVTTVAAQSADVPMVVANTEGQGARLREAPSTSATVIAVLDEGARVQAMGDQIPANGFVWWHVRDGEGRTGFVVSEFLTLAPERVANAVQPPTAPPTLVSLTPTQPALQAQQQAAEASPCPAITDLFPEWNDPEGAVQRAISENLQRRGINPYRANPAVQRVMEAYGLPPDDAVAGWVAHSLYWAVRGEPSHMMTLSQYVERQYEIRMALGSLVRSRPNYLGPVITREQWAEMQAWPANTCAGAVMRSPANARLIRLMARSVGDTSWLHG